MSTFSDIHHQTWMAFHRAMISDVPMSVLHPGFPVPHPHVEDRKGRDDKGLSYASMEALRIDPLTEASMEWQREEQQYYEANPEQWEEEDIADEWPIDVWAY